MGLGLLFGWLMVYAHVFVLVSVIIDPRSLVHVCMSGSCDGDMKGSMGSGG